MDYHIEFTDDLMTIIDEDATGATPTSLIPTALGTLSKRWSVGDVSTSSTRSTRSANCVAT